MSDQKINIIIVVAASVILSILNSPIFPVFFDDTEIFQYIGLLMKKGGTIYIDVFDHKPPLIYFLNFLKVEWGVWFFWALDMLLVLFTSLKFLELTIKYKLLFPFVLPVLINLLLRHPGYSMGFGMTREYTTLFLLLGFCALINNKKWTPNIIGFLGSCIFFMQQDQIILYMPLVVYWAYNSWKQGFNKLISGVLKLLCGIVIIPLLLLVYLLLHHALSAFWQDAFQFNFSWYSTRPHFSQTLITIKNYLQSFDLLNLYVLCFIICIAGFIVGSNRRLLLLTSVFLLALSFISEYVTSALTTATADVWYYFLPLSATVPIALFTVFAFSKQELLKHRVYQGIIYFALLFSPVLSTVVRAANFHKYPQDWIATSGELKYLRSQDLKDFDLYAINCSNYVYAYNEFNLLAPSPWIYHYFWSWYPAWDTDHSKLYSIIKDLEAHQTKFIIDDTYITTFGTEENKAIWHSYLEARFHNVPGLKLWVRN